MSTCGLDCSAVGGEDPCSAPSCYQTIVRVAPPVALPSDGVVVPLRRRKPLPASFYALAVPVVADREAAVLWLKTH